MSKLFKFKEYLTLEESCDYLSASLQETITINDIYMLALDDHLTLSVKFFDLVTISSGRVYKDNEESITPEILISHGISVGEELDVPYKRRKQDGFFVSLREWLFFSDRVDLADGVWDLTMLGLERRYIENLYLGRDTDHIGKSSGVNGFIQAIVLKRFDSFCKLKIIEVPDGGDINQKRTLILNARAEEFYDCDTFDDFNFHFVVKVEELKRFIQLLSKEAEAVPVEEKSLHPRERASYLKLIYGLLHLHGIDPSTRGVTGAVQKIVEESGNEINPKTINKILNQVSDAYGNHN